MAAEAVTGSLAGSGSTAGSAAGGSVGSASVAADSGSSPRTVAARASISAAACWAASADSARKPGPFQAGISAQPIFEWSHFEPEKWDQLKPFSLRSFCISRASFN